MLHRLTEKIGPWLNDSIDAHGRGENIGWESALMPGPQGEALLVVFVWMPGAVLGTNLHGSFSIPDPLNFTQDECSRTIAEFLRQMREGRSQQIAAQGGQTPQEGPGRAQRPSGLILPT